MRDNLLTKFKEVLSGTPRTLVLHSSLVNLMPGKDFNTWDLLYVIKNLVKEGWTICLPSFTFSYTKNGQFDINSSHSETGILADLVQLHLPDSIRTNNPIYSFVAIGANAKDILNCKNSTTFSDDSTFGYFDKNDSLISMLGSGWTSCTQIHRYEELSQVKYRYYKNFTGSVNYGNGYETNTIQMFVRDLDIDPKIDMNLIRDHLESNSTFKETTLYRNKLISITTSELKRTVMDLLNIDPYILLKNKNYIKKAILEKENKNSYNPIKIALFASYNVNNIEKKLDENLNFYIRDRKFEILKIPYGQYRQELYNKDSVINSQLPEIRVFLDGLSQLGNFDDYHDLESSVQEYFNTIMDSHKKIGGVSIVSNFIDNHFYTNYKDKIDAFSRVHALNLKMLSFFSKEDNVHIFDLNHEIIKFNDSVFDKRLWYIGKFIFTEKFGNHLSKEIVSIIASLYGFKIKLIVLDLDNTLWGGVLGEDGIEGIYLGGDYPGNAFLKFQDNLIKLNNDGIALAIISKNNEDDALEIINTHPFMRIKGDRISAYRINWEKKHVNLLEISNELNIGLNSILFVDDNFTERENIKENLPEVKVLELSEDPAFYSTELELYPLLKSTVITEEDKNRIRNYKNNRKLKIAISAGFDTNEYLEKLDIHVYLNNIDSLNFNRVHQLTHKTNQFNTTTKRYSSDEIKKMQDNEYIIIVVGYKDKNQVFENIGLLYIRVESGKVATIENYLLSCRILGRGLELTLILYIKSYLYSLGYFTLRGEILKNDKNRPTHEIYEKCGFEEKSDGIWKTSLTSDETHVSHIKIINNLKI